MTVPFIILTAILDECGRCQGACLTVLFIVLTAVPDECGISVDCPLKFSFLTAVPDE